MRMHSRGSGSPRIGAQTDRAMSWLGSVCWMAPGSRVTQGMEWENMWPSRIVFGFLCSTPDLVWGTTPTQNGNICQIRKWPKVSGHCPIWAVSILVSF